MCAFVARNSLLLPALGVERQRLECEPVSPLRERVTSCKYLYHVYLNVRGEVAERLKAAVC